MSDSKTLLRKADSALLRSIHMCMCVSAPASPSLFQSIPSFPLPHSHFASTSAVPLLLIPPCAGCGDTRFLLFRLAAGSAPASLCASRVLSSPSSLCLPLWVLPASLLPWLLLLEHWSCLTQNCYAATTLPRFSSLPFASHSPLLDNHH